MPFDGLDVLVHRAESERAATGHAHGGFTGAAQQGTHHDERGTHLADQCVGRVGVQQLGGVDGQAVGPGPGVAGAHVAGKFQNGVYVAEPGNAMQGNRLTTQEAGHQDGQGGIFTGLDSQLSSKGTTALDTQWG